MGKLKTPRTFPFTKSKTGRKPGRHAALRPILALAAGLLTLLATAACIDERPAPTPTRSQPAPTAGPAAIAAAKQEYLTTLLWHEIAAAQAERQPQTFQEVLNWQPDAGCIDPPALQATAPEQLPAFAQAALDCLLTDLTGLRPQTKPWKQQTWAQKEKAAAAALQRAWISQSPEDYFQYAAAARDGFAIDRRSSPPLGRFAATYDHCKPTHGQARLLGRSPNGERAARLWIQYAEARQRCIARQHEENYPLEHQKYQPRQASAGS